MSEITPTPGIENMDRKMAVRHFNVRLEQIKANIDSLPPAEMFKLAGELLDAGLEAKMAISVARRAIQKLELADVPR